MSASSDPSSSRFAPYHADYIRLTQEGHRRPTTRLDAPALIWHVAFWPKKDADAQDAKIVRETGHGANATPWWGRRAQRQSEELSADERSYRDAVDRFNTRRRKVARQFSGFLADLQRRGRSVPSSEFEELAVIEHGESLKGRQGEEEVPKTVIYDKDSFGFTLWWHDEAGVQEGCVQDPPPTHLRVRVQVDAYLDFISITFCIDPKKPYDLWSLMPEIGDRRGKILREVAKVTTLGDGRIARLDPAADLLPETDVNELQAADMLGAASFLYEEIWDQFREAFGIDLTKIAGPDCEVFANFIGLVLPTKGHQARADNSNLDETTFDPAGVEADRVVAGYFPFVRRVVPAADHRQFTVSGIVGWKAMYISSLGAPSGFAQSDESKVTDPNGCAWDSADVPSDHLPEPPAAHREDTEQQKPVPIRYMIFVRNAPDRKQLARLVERMNAMGSVRLFALRDFLKIREASTHIRMRGQELDLIVREWTDKQDDARKKIDSDHDEDARNTYFMELSSNSQQAERRLIGISAALDRVGEDTVGGLPFRVARATYYMDVFRSLLKSLRVQRIEKWMPYDEFVARGLEPTFQFITSVGVRLEKLRTRLQNAMQAVQTSAIVAQTEATRQLGAEARKQSHATDRLAFAAILIAALTLVYDSGYSKHPLFDAVSRDVHGALGLGTVRTELLDWGMAILMALFFVGGVITLLVPFVAMPGRIRDATWFGRAYFAISFAVLLLFCWFIAASLAGVLVDLTSPMLSVVLEGCCAETLRLGRESTAAVGLEASRRLAIIWIVIVEFYIGLRIMIWGASHRRLRERM